jgi:hypothetical protein
MAKKKKAKKARKVTRKARPKVKAKAKGQRSKIKAKGQRPKVEKQKLIGLIDHYFDKISVAAIKVKAPFKVGDVIHVQGHTTNFYQRVESMQINHQEVNRVKKGDDVGMKIKEFVRTTDKVYLGTEKDLQAQPRTSGIMITKPGEPKKPLYQTSIFKKEEKPLFKPAPKPAVQPPPVTAAPPPPPKKPEKHDPYSNTRFFNF